jgi:hypothetical protein
VSEVIVRSWVERIDGACWVANAEFRQVHRGQIFAAATMLLFEPREGWYRAKERAVEKLKIEIVPTMSAIRPAKPTNPTAVPRVFAARRSRAAARRHGPPNWIGRRKAAARPEKSIQARILHQS